MRHYLLTTALGLGLLSCDYPYRASQATTRPKEKEINIADFVKSSLPNTEKVVIAYDAYETTPFNTSRPFEPVLPNATVSQLERELSTASDPARKQSLEDTLEFMKACDHFTIPYTVARVARDRPLSSSVSLYGLLPTIFVYAFKQPEKDEVVKINEMYQHRWRVEKDIKGKNIKSYRIHKGIVTSLD